jgi:hypothetical protein
MADDLDLSGKRDDEEAAASTKAGTKGRGGATAAAQYTRPDRAERAWERDLRTRMERTLDRLIEWRQGRGDDDLVKVLKEDGPAMIGGVIAALRPVRQLEKPVVLMLTIAEPLLAFGRLFKVLGSRVAARRAVRAEEWEQEQAAAAEAAEAEEAREAGRGFQP